MRLKAALLMCALWVRVVWAQPDLIEFQEGGIAYQLSHLSNYSRVAADGTFESAVFEGFEYDISIIPDDGQALARSEFMDIKPVTNNDGMSTLDGAMTLSGIVSYKDGTPYIGGPTILAAVYLYDQVTGDTVATEWVDEFGRYAFSVSPGTYKLGVRRSNNFSVNSSAHQNIVIADQDVTYNITLPFVTLSGVLLDTDGQPVRAHLRTNTFGTVDGVSYWLNTSTASDIDGSYSLMVFDGINYTFDIEPIGDTDVAVARITDVLVDGDTVHDFSLAKGFDLTLSVTTESEPLTQINYSVIPLDGSFPPISEYVYGGETTFSLLEGGYRVSFYRTFQSLLLPNMPELILFDYELSPINLNADISINYTIPLSNPFHIQVVDENGVGLDGVMIDLLQEGVTQEYSYRVRDLNAQTTAASGYSVRMLKGQPMSVDIKPSADSGFAFQSLTVNEVTDNAGLSVVLIHADNQLPVIISGPYLKNVQSTSAVIAWQTDEPTNGSVEVGGQTFTKPGYTTNHVIRVSGLSPETLYTAVVSSVDVQGNGPVTASVDFTTKALPDNAAPVIVSGPIVESITHNSALVRWRTNEPTTFELAYGVGNTNTVVSGSEPATEHEYWLTDLSALATYALQLSVRDVAGNGSVTRDVITFTTLAQPDVLPPVITAGPFVSDTTDSEATITWQTNEPSVSGVSLNDGTQYLVYRDETYVTDHQVRVTGLSAQTLYHYTVSSTDALGNGPTLSQTKSFTTLAGVDVDPPVITEALKIVGITHQSAVVHWRTDEPADGRVFYRAVSAQGQEPWQMAAEAKLQTKHVIQLVDLVSDTDYEVYVVSKDSQGNEVISHVSTFSTRSRPDTQGPVFTQEPTLVDGKKGKAVLQWETSESAECTVQYQPSQGGEVRRVEEKGRGTKHSVVLSELEEDMNYTFTVLCRDAQGNQSQWPEAADESLGSTGSNATKAYANTQVRDVLQDTLHTGSTWLAQAAHFVVPAAKAQTVMGNTFSISSSQEVTGPQWLQAPLATLISDDAAVLVWETDVPTTGEVSYQAQDSTEVQRKAATTYDGVQVVVLTNLLPNTQYAVTVQVQDVGDSTLTETLTLISASSTNTSVPNASSVVSDLRGGDLLVTLQSDQYASAELVCGDVLAGTQRQSAAEGLRTSHRLWLESLAANTEYTCQVTLTNALGGASQSQAFTVTVGDINSIDSDGDGVVDAEDDFPNDPAAAKDTDKDGLPDEWLQSATPEQVAASGLTLDSDDDGDGYSDAEELESGSDPLSASDVPIQSGLSPALIKAAVEAGQL
jgi:chitodextrinase